ncbi:hypothetical protein BG000_003626, partial [Podila horticola]
MPVRQALHSFIASSCDKPPASKEEAQAVLEEMFRLRAEKVRRAIEQGKLATTEALRLRRESVGVSEGSHRATASPTSHTPDSEQKASGCRQEKRVVSSTLVAEPGMEMGQDLGSRGASLYNQSATWGLSDDEIMSSFTTFTAKLGDTLLARDGATNTNKAGGNNTNSNSDIGFIKPEAIQIQTNMPVLSPTLGHSPTTSTESDSPSPWTPWIPLNNSNSNNNTHGPTNNVDVAQQNNRSGVQAPHLFAQTSLFPAFPQDIVLPAGYDPQQQRQQRQQQQQPPPQLNQLQQTQAWNQYMQYLLHQQEQEGPISLPIQQQQLLYGQVRFAQHNPNPNPNPSPSPSPNPPFPSQASGASGQGVDPHWQATMMAMMMEDPTLESFGG